MEELLEAKVAQSYIEYNLVGMDALEYNADTNMVTNVKPLELGKYYRIPFVITYEGKEYLLREDDEEEKYYYPYTGYIQVGVNVYYEHGFVTFNEKYSASNGTANYGNNRMHMMKIPRPGRTPSRLMSLWLRISTTAHRRCIITSL